MPFPKSTLPHQSKFPPGANPAMTQANEPCRQKEKERRRRQWRGQISGGLCLSTSSVSGVSSEPGSTLEVLSLRNLGIGLVTGTPVSPTRLRCRRPFRREPPGGTHLATVPGEEPMSGVKSGGYAPAHSGCSLRAAEVDGVALGGPEDEEGNRDGPGRRAEESSAPAGGRRRGGQGEQLRRNRPGTPRRLQLADAETRGNLPAGGGTARRSAG